MFKSEACVHDYFVSRFIVRYKKKIHGNCISVATIVLARDCVCAALKVAKVEGIPVEAIEYARAL